MGTTHEPHPPRVRPSSCSSRSGFWRNPASATFTIAFPVFFLVIFGVHEHGRAAAAARQHQFQPVLHSEHRRLRGGDGRGGLVNLGINLPFRRDTGLLKRMRGTPLPIPAFVFGLLASAFLVSAILTVFANDVRRGGSTTYEFPFVPPAPARASCYWSEPRPSVRLASRVASLVPNADAAPAIVNAVLLPARVPVRHLLPGGPGFGVSHRSPNVFPVRPFLQATFATFDPLHFGSRLQWDDPRQWWPHWGVVAALRRGTALPLGTARHLTWRSPAVGADHPSVSVGAHAPPGWS